MNPELINTRALRALLILLVVGLSACARITPVEPVMTTSNPLIANPRPWCIGRFVLDRPANSKISSEEYEFWGDKIDVARNVSVGTFQHKVDTRERELGTRKRTILIPYKESVRRGLPNGVVEIDVPWLEKVVSPSATSRLMIFKEDGDADSSFKGEGHALAGSTMLTMKSVLGSGAVQKVIRREGEWYRYITYRDDWAVPTERGFCIEGALIGGPSRNSELLHQGMVLQPGRPSLFLIDVRDAVDVDQQTSLLKTLPDLRRELRTQGYSGYVSVLRKGKRQVAGMDAEEVLFSIRSGSVQLYRFYLLAPGNPDTVAQPHTEIRLNLGSANHPALRATLPPELATSPVDEA
ncbi:hypothetical protein SAMN05216345_1071, partial [Cupriavidus sp. YR651]|uniref:T6SS immunity protein Tli4 family protein n=1 Tax=Cupriavidus sp. YR651 TaxID=1855315 RepID=UPI000889FA1D